MLGVMLCVGKEEKLLWCPVVYEFLPDFCYTCGIIGHIDNVTYQKFDYFPMCEFLQKFKTFCVNM
jgi:hypothetical protein